MVRKIWLDTFLNFHTSGKVGRLGIKTCLSVIDLGQQQKKWPLMTYQKPNTSSLMQQ